MADDNFDEEHKRAEQEKRHGEELAAFTQQQRLQQSKIKATSRGTIESRIERTGVEAANPRDIENQRQNEPAQQTPDEEPIQLPSLIGMSPGEAQQQLTSLGLAGFESPTPTPGVTQPLVVGMSPGPGSEVSPGESVTLMIQVPEDQDQNEDQDRDKEERQREEPEEAENEAGTEPGPEGEGAGNAGDLAGEDLSGYGLGGGAGDIGAGVTGGVPIAGAGGAAGAGAGAGAATEGAVAATAPFWGTAALIVGGILVILGLVFFIFIALMAKCNEDSWTGKGVRILSTVSTFFGAIPDDFCKQVAVNQAPPSGGAGATGVTPLNIQVTDAYRPQEVGSAHARGEAADIALFNPTVPIHGNDPRIQQLFQIVASEGFTFVLDEYATPSAGATAGHVHMQFDLRSDGTSSCDGIKPNPPKDLVAITAPILVKAGVDARVRPCMLNKLMDIFTAAGY